MLSISLLSFIHMVAETNGPFFIIATWYLIVWIYKVLLIISPLNCFWLFATVYKTGINISVKVFLWTFIFLSFEEILGSRNARSDTKYVFCLFPLFCNKNTPVVIWKVMGMFTISAVLKFSLAYVHTLQIACIKYKTFGYKFYLKLFSY